MRTSLFGILMLAISVAQSGTGAAQGAAPQGVGDPANGKAVFAFGNTSCTNCHGLEGQGGWGPDLAGRRITYDQAIAAIRNPMWRMPAFVPSQLSDKEILDMVAYWNTLPVAPAIGKWRNEAPADGPRAQQLAVNIIGCGQCHGDTMSTPRHGAAGMNADFEWFKKQVYNHATADAGTVEAARWRRARDGRAAACGWAISRPKRVPESQLQEIWTWMNDLGMVVPLVARLTSGQTTAAGTTYTLEVENEGLKDKGVAAEDVTISIDPAARHQGGVSDWNGISGHQERREGQRRRGGVAPARDSRRMSIRSSRLRSRERQRATRFREERWHMRNRRPRRTRS